MDEGSTPEEKNTVTDSNRGLRRLARLIHRATRSYLADGGPVLGAGLAYYALFSLAPAGAIVMRIVGIFYDPVFVEATLRPELEAVFSDGTVDTLFRIMTGLSKPGGGTLVTTAVAVGLLIFGATGFFNTLKDVLDRIWQIREGGSSSVRRALKSRALALLSLLVLAGVVLALVVADRTLAALIPTLNRLFPEVAAFQPEQFVREFISLVVIRFGLIWLVIAYAFRVLPDAHIHWRDLWLGSGVTALLFLLGQIGIGYYLQHTNLASVYGAAGSVVLILAWVYYSAQVFLFGGELTYQIAETFGQDIQPDSRRDQPTEKDEA